MLIFGMKKAKCHWLLAILVTLAAMDEVHSSTPAAAPSQDCGGLSKDDSSSFAKFKQCTVNPTYNVIGNNGQFVTLDFSTATPDGEITKFFQKAKTPITLSAGIRLVDNKVTTSISFGPVQKWIAPPNEVPPGSLFIEIVNNLLLAEIKSQVTIFAPGAKIKILFYNNPKLTFNDAFIPQPENHIVQPSYIEKEKQVCRFQNPLNKAEYSVPSAEMLKECKTFKGDLKLVQETLSGDIKFEEGCLILVNVDTEKVTAITTTGKGKDQCNISGGAPSQIKDVKGLCGEKRTALAKYFPPPSTVVDIPLDTACTKICTKQTEVDQEFYRCSEVHGDVNIASWFTNSKLVENQKTLIKAQGKVTIKSDTVKQISLPAVTEMSYLQITENKELIGLNLSSLGKVEELVITKNDKLGLQDVAKGLAKASPTKKTVECNALAKDVTDVGQLRLCTIINGPLKLSNVVMDVNEADFAITDVKGCLMVENTRLSNLDFLKKANIQCPGKHLLKNNPKLCKPNFLGAKVDMSPKNTDCGKECTNLSDQKCVVYNGDLKIDGSTKGEDLKLLKKINGKLIISGTTHASLDFPALVTISASNAPALEMTNNAKLTSLKMPKLAKITAATPGTPRVKIENNPMLSSDLRQFLPADIKCSKSASSDCQYDQFKEDEEGVSTDLLVVIGVAGGLLLFGGIGAGVFIYKKKKSKIIAESGGDSVDEEASGSSEAATPVGTEFADDFGVPVPRVSKEMANVSKLLNGVRQFPDTSNASAIALMAEGIATLPYGPLELRILANQLTTPALWREYGADRKERFPRFRFNRGVFLINKDYLLHQKDFINQLRRQVKDLRNVNKKKKGAPKKKKSEEDKSDDEEEEDESRKTAGKGEKVKEEKGKKGGGKGGNAPKRTKGKNNPKKEKKANKQKKRKSAKSKSDEDEPKSDKAFPYILHIGQGFVRSQEFDKNMKISHVEGQDERVLTHRKNGLKCSIIHIKYTEGKETLLDLDFILLEVIVDSHIVGGMTHWLNFPWFGLLHEAFKRHWTMNTDVPDFFALMYLIFWTTDVVHRRAGELDSAQTKNFILNSLYPAFKDLYMPAELGYEAVNSVQFLAILVMHWHRFLEPNPSLLKASRQGVQDLLVADTILLQRGQNSPLSPWVQSAEWYLNPNNFPEDVQAMGIEKFKQYRLFPPEAKSYYTDHQDKAPWCLLVPAGTRLPLQPVIDFEKEDEETGAIQPQKSLSAVSVIQIPTFHVKEMQNERDAAYSFVKHLPPVSVMSMAQNQEPAVGEKKEDKKKSDDKSKDKKKEVKKKEKEESDSDD